MLLGTTYSHQHISYLSIDQDSALAALLEMHFDIVRLCCYWSEIENKKGTYDFSRMHHILETCEKKHQDVVVTVGMKAPRWPEFYIPKWARYKTIFDLIQPVLTFNEKCIEELKQYSCIKYWQVENEPLDPSGPHNLIIPLDMLQQEIQRVRNLDPLRSIVVNLWGNELSKRQLLQDVLPMTDIVGLDIYYKQFIIKKLSMSFYSGPGDSDTKLSEIIQSVQKPVWITELQAEPWEINNTAYKSKNPKSINNELLKINYARVKKLDPEAILFWGFEYWLWKKLQGDSRMLDTIKEILEREKKYNI